MTPSLNDVVIGGPYYDTGFIGAPGSTEEAVEKEGKKFDNDKLKWNLLPIESVEEIVRVLTYGAIKYSEDPKDPNWKKVEEPEERYYAALMRHLAAWKKGELDDPETDIPHLAHAGANLLFLIYFNNKQNGK